MTMIAGIRIPDSMMAPGATQRVHDTGTGLLYYQSRRVFLFGSLAGVHEQLKYDSELLAHGTIHKPETIFGNVKADVLALKDPHYHRENFWTMTLGSAWKD
jgi:hypothetical protein